MRGWTRFLETCPSQIVYDSVTKMYDTPFDFSQALSGPVPPEVLKADLSVVFLPTSD